MRDFRARAIGIVFFAYGVIFGTWSASIPTVRQGLGLDEAQLGTVILFFSVGVIFGNPLSVYAMRTWGIYLSSAAGLITSVGCFALAVAAAQRWQVMALLTLGGSMFSVLNVAINSAAAHYEEQRLGRIMSTCHGLWSAGAMVGSAVCSAVNAGGLHPFYWFLTGVSVLGVCCIGYARRGIRDLEVSTHAAPGSEGKRPFQWPTHLLWSIILVSMCVNLTEGTMADWAAIFMRDEVGAPLWLEGWGFSVYAFCMAAMRFLGDRLLMQHRAERILYWCGLGTCAGLMLAVWTQTTVPTLIGFGMVGAGVALGAPILYGAAARVPDMAPGAGLATMNTFAMVGFLSGPALIGYLARSVSLPVAFAVVAGITLFWAWKAARFKTL